MTSAAKPKALKAHITHLEMTARPSITLQRPANIHTAIMRVTEIPLPFYHFIYRQVGARWHWVDRIRMDDVTLARHLHAQETHIHVLYINGAPAGFFEFHELDGSEIELTHFGLMRHALGLGVGKWFLQQALYAIWELSPEKVVVTTNTLDHPRALQLYQRFGFAPVKTSDALIRPLSDAELLNLTKRDIEPIELP